MSRTYIPALATSWTILQALIALNLLVGALILALLFASLVAEGPVMAALGAPADAAHATLIRGMRLIMVIGIAATPLTHRLLTRLMAIVETVRRGHPFRTQNAARLKTIAWALLGLELLHLAAGATAAAVSSKAAPLDLDWNFSVTGWLAVVLLFVLARVFEHGALIEEELEATI